MRTIAVGDIHGCYKELKTLIDSLKEKGVYRPKKDKLVFLGDYVDRGEDTRNVIKYIKQLQRKNKNVIALMGNHEDMLIDAYKRGYLEYIDVDTLKSYDGSMEALRHDVEWMEKLPIYHEDDKCIYVHAGINLNMPMALQNRMTMLWTREEFIYSSVKRDKMVVFGHTPTLFLNNGVMPVYTKTHNLCIDTGCIYGGNLTAVVIENGKVKNYYQVEKEDIGYGKEIA